MARNDLNIDLDEHDGEPESRRRAPKERGTVNLTVSPEMAKKWREWCVRYDFKQRDAFEEAFELMQQRYGR